MTTHDDIYYATATPIPPPPNAPTAAAPLRSSYNISRGSTKAIDSQQIKRLLDQGYTKGLAHSLNDLQTNFPLRMWVVDNSGSMAKTDGHQFVQTGGINDIKVVSCTRWKEIQDCVNYHVQLSALLTAPTVFRLLNNPGISAGAQEFGIATQGEDMIPTDVDKALNIMSRTRPSGCTPLIEHIREIHATITAMKSSLESEGKRVVVVLATDGLPTNSFGESNSFIKDQFVQSLRALEGLPVWLVVRLSTDEEEVVDFYNGLDDQLELSMDVLDDFCGEAEEIYEHNPWMNYALPIHRLRELGYHDRILDMIDERPLTQSEIRDYCLLLFGAMQCDGLPDPAIDWKGFMDTVKALLDKEELQWNPMKKKPMPWINLKQLNKQYGDNSCVIM
jgi:hypothetical protein